jgi:hypothetical protein
MISFLILNPAEFLRQREQSPGVALQKGGQTEPQGRGHRDYYPAWRRWEPVFLQRGTRGADRVSDGLEREARGVERHRDNMAAAPRGAGRGSHGVRRW